MACQVDRPKWTTLTCMIHLWVIHENPSQPIVWGLGCRVQRCRVYGNNYFTEMCSGSEAGSHLRLIYFVYYSTLGLRVIKKKREVRMYP